MAGLAPKPVVLYCAGCFNPITNKHLRIMELARDALHRTGKYKVLKGIIAPAHDAYPKKGLLPATHRYEMAKLAVRSNSMLCIDSWEMEQSDWTPTQIALAKLKDRISAETFSVSGSIVGEDDQPKAKKSKSGSRASASHEKTEHLPKDTGVRLLCGGDLLESFAVPDLWAKEHMESIARDFGLVVIVRDGSDPYKYIYENDMLSKYTHNIDVVFDRFGDDLSSTKVRRAIERNESVKYLLQDSVLDYIITNKLYNPNYKPGDLFPSS